VSPGPRRARIGTRAAVVFASALTLSGCLGGSLLPSSRSTTHVDSVPSGAEVLAMGERLGITPLEVDDASVYPVSYPREKASLYGKLVLRHPGCEDFEQALTLEAANRGVVAKLVCPGQTSDGEVRTGQRSVRERLAEIEALHGDALVTQGEASTLRDRVLREALAELSAPEALRVLEALRAEGAVDEREYQAWRSETLDRL
jgi:hypothetical protein